MLIKLYNSYKQIKLRLLSISHYNYLEIVIHQYFDLSDM